MTPSPDQRPAAVPTSAQQAGPVRERWPWAEPAVWTERMLTALETGVQGGVWFRLVDKVYSERNLVQAYQRVAANQGCAGVDRVTVEQFGKQLDANLRQLHDGLRRNNYVPQAVVRHYIPKPGSDKGRPLGIPTVRDRVVQTALRHVLEPIFERGFAAHSYGFRPGRGCKDALRRVQQLLDAGYHYVVDADLQSYFDTIPHERLLERVRQRVADGRVLALLAAFLKQGVLDGLREWTPEEGTPQGAVISPLLSNIYLDPLDRQMAEQGWEMVRYADDFVVMCRSPEEAERALAAVQQWVEGAGLKLHAEKTRIVNVAEGHFDFLGYRFERDQRGPRPKSLEKFKDAIREKTGRNDGRSLLGIIDAVNRTARGWFEYFKHGRRRTFQSLDGWIRMRLRSILRRRRKGRGCGRGADHQRWPNRFFGEQGLFGLVKAHELACQSPLG